MTWYVKSRDRNEDEHAAITQRVAECHAATLLRESKLKCACGSGLPVLYTMRPKNKILAAYCQRCKPYDYIRDFRRQLMDAFLKAEAEPDTEPFPESAPRPDRCKSRGCPYPSMVPRGECRLCDMLEFYCGRLVSSWRHFEMLMGDVDMTDEEIEAERMRVRASDSHHSTDKQAEASRESLNLMRGKYGRCLRPRVTDGKPCQSMVFSGLDGCIYHGKPLPDQTQPISRRELKLQLRAECRTLNEEIVGVMCKASRPVTWRDGHAEWGDYPPEIQSRLDELNGHLKAIQVRLIAEF